MIAAPFRERVAALTARPATTTAISSTRGVMMESLRACRAWGVAGHHISDGRRGQFTVDRYRRTGIFRTRRGEDQARLSVKDQV